MTKQREIKFRAWDTVSRQWATPLINTQKRTLFVIPDADCVLMQFTGLCDKNGKEIYEGDIVVGVHGLRGDVQFCALDSLSRFGVKWHTKNMVWNSDMLGVEVIGNIYENPELLEGKP